MVREDMKVRLCMFEDAGWSRLLPLVYFRPVYDLRCGVSTVREKAALAFKDAEMVLHCRAVLADAMRLRNPDMRVNEWPAGDYLLVNGRALLTRTLETLLKKEKGWNIAYVSGGNVVAARVHGDFLQSRRAAPGEPFTAEEFNHLAKIEVDAETISYPWDIVGRNGDAIVADFVRMNLARKRAGDGLSRQTRGVYRLGKHHIHCGKGVTIMPGTVLDAQKGPIYLGPGVTIQAHALIQGPVGICDQSLVKAGSHIYDATTIGPVCKVGGEIEASVIQGYSNKQHAGFLGHACLGSWVNLGADTNNSDLKNNYGSIRVTLPDGEVDTGLQFVGVTMGDHSKTAINTMFNTGTVVGTCCNVFGAGFPPKFIPSFSWGGSEGSIATYDVEKAIDVARRVMSRRGVPLNPAEERLIRETFHLTSGERGRGGLT